MSRVIKAYEESVERYRDARGRLQTLEEDLSAQFNSLSKKDDVSWDCYDKSNWKSMHENIMKIANYLNMNITNRINCEECEDEECDCENINVDND